SRRGVRARFAAFRRAPGRPLLWMHAPSVGEGLQARPVLELSRERARQWQLAYTYFSPSAERFALGLNVDFRDVLPFDGTGDTRFAQVWARAARADLTGPLLAPLRSDRPTLVAGSTWPTDEKPLLEAWSNLREQHPEARLIIAPHEPTAVHLEPIEQWARTA